jgi:hypothetical protein
MVAVIATLMMLLVFVPSPLQLNQQQTNEELPEPEQDRDEEIEKNSSETELDEQRVTEHHIAPLPITCQTPETIIIVSVAPPLHPSQFSVRRLI